MLLLIFDVFVYVRLLVDVVVVEGVGGFCVLLLDDFDMVEMVVVLGLFVVLVVGLCLGCLNYVVFIVEVIVVCGLYLVGWVGNVVDLVMVGFDDNVIILCWWINVLYLGMIL